MLLSRRLGSSCVLALCALGGLGSLWACGSDAVGSAPEDPVDVDAGPTADAAARDDGAAPPNNEKMTSATVEANVDGAPAAGLSVVVNREDGSLVAHAKTGGDGRVTVRVPKGGSFSLVRERNDGGSNDASLYRWRQIDTFVAPPDGWTLRTADTTFAAPPPPPAPMKITIPTVAIENRPAGADPDDSMDIEMSCDQRRPLRYSGQDNIEYKGCNSADTYDLIAIARRRADGVPIGFKALLDNIFIPGKSVTHELALTNTAFETATTTLADLPLGAKVSFTARGSRGKNTLVTNWGKEVASAATSSLSETMKLPAGVFSRLQFTEDALVDNGLRPRWSHRRYASSGPPSSVVSLDALARIRNVQRVDTGAVERPEIRWALGEKGSREGCAFSSAEFSAGKPGSGLGLRWYAHRAAAGDSHAGFPELPDELVDFRPTGPNGRAVVYNQHVAGKTGLDACVTPDSGVLYRQNPLGVLGVWDGVPLDVTSWSEASP